MMGALRAISAIFWLVITVPPAAILAFPWTFITRNPKFLYWIGTRIMAATGWFLGARVRMLGLENFDPNGTYIFMSNHVSNLDPIVLMPRIPRRTSVLAKKDVWKIPVVGAAMTLVSIVPIERNNREAAVQSIQRAGEVMKQGINMMLYPEGTRSLDGRLLPFKKGPFHLAMGTGFPIVPVTMLGTAEIMPKGKFGSRKGIATVVFHKPIDPTKFSTREELMQAVADAINSALPSAA